MIFDPVFPFWVIILVILSLALFMVWLESKKSYRFRMLRFVSVSLMMTALAGLLLKPGYCTEKTSAIILLTPGYSERKVDSVLQREPKAILMQLDNTARYKNSKALHHYNLADLDKEIQVVLGQGLPAHYLDLMENKVFQFIPAPEPAGITELYFPSNATVGRRHTISGVFNGIQRDIWIFLNGPAGKEDSVFLKKGRNDFRLGFIPKQPGQFVYTVLVQDSVNSYLESLPIHILEEQKFNILFLQQYPTFETQSLKNFLERKNHSIVLRQQVSENNFRYEYINREPIALARITSELLEDMDLIITDPESLSNFSPAENNILEKFIRAGLGLISLPVTDTRSSPFFPWETTQVKTDTTNIRIASRSYNFPVTRVRVLPNASTIVLQKNKSGILSGYTFHGAGKIGFQLLQETYRLNLSGDSTTYSDLWVPLLEKVARPDFKPSKIKITTPFPVYENEPVDIEVMSTSENVSLTADSIELPLKEDISIDNVWHARTWAAKPGWHVLETEDGTFLPYYVSDSNEWRPLALTNQLKANNHHKSFSQSPKKIEMLEEISPWIFYMIFLVTAGFIWLAPKL